MLEQNTLDLFDTLDEILQKIETITGPICSCDFYGYVLYIFFPFLFPVNY